MPACIEIPDDDELETATTPAKVAVPSHPDPASSFFYDGKFYWIENGESYLRLADVSSVRRHLKEMGCGGDKDHLGLRPDDYAINRIQRDQSVVYAGSIAGHKRGLHYFKDGRRVLVTDEAKLPVPATGDWSTLQKVFSGLLVDETGDQTQMHVLFGWIKVAFENLQAGKYRPGQALALAGPVRCGKSLLIDVLKAIFGGRHALPYAYLTGQTQFNGEMGGAELLVIDDDAASTDPRARRVLGGGLKSNLFAASARVHPKGWQAFICRPWWRLIFAVNDEPQCLMVLPELTEDLHDKIILMKCRRFTLPMPAGTDEEKAAFWAILAGEIPAFLAWLAKWEIPTELREERCGVAFYHHPELVEGLRALAPETQLWHHIQAAVEAGHIELPVTLTARELEDKLTLQNVAARRLLDWHGACGSYLGKLAKMYPERVRKGKLCQGNARWELLPLAG